MIKSVGFAMLVHYITLVSSCPFHHVHFIMSISPCSFHPVHFTMFISSCSFHLVNFIMIITSCTFHHVNFIMFISPRSFHVQVLYLVPLPALLDVCRTLLQHQMPSVRRKALDMLNTKLQTLQPAKLTQREVGTL